jgi:hypothetical protein
LGVEAERIHTQWLHSPGNLTLSAYNRELWNHAFSIKRTEYAGSNIVLTRDLAQKTTWGENEIRARAETLAQTAIGLWPGPKAPLPVLQDPPVEVRIREVISVTLRWSEAGQDAPDETISEQHSSTTMARVLSRFATICGAFILERLAQVTTGRGPFVSETPARDFLNPSTGQPYASQAVPGSNRFVITNNSNAEKMELLRELPTRLGFPRTMLSVTTVSKTDALLQDLGL